MIDLLPGTVIAHRGASATRPENTEVAFQYAYELGAKWLEFDVILTKDLVPIIHHDYNCGRTLPGSGFIHEKNYDELKTLDCGSWFGAGYANARCMTLASLMQFCQQCDLGMNIELKAVNDEIVTSLVEAIVTVYQQQSIPAHKLLFSSFNWTCLQVLRRQLPTVALGVLAEDYDETVLAMAKALSAYSIHLSAQAITITNLPKILSAINNYKLMLYTVNNKQQALELFDVGVHAVFSDIPDLLKV